MTVTQQIMSFNPYSYTKKTRPFGLSESSVKSQGNPLKNFKLYYARAHLPKRLTNLN